VVLLDLKGVHFLLTYKCSFECDHCFVWGSPRAQGAFTLKQIRKILAEAKKLGTVNFVSVEGGEPFLYYPIMVQLVKEATSLGFHVEVLSNCYWANCVEDAVDWLRPMANAENVEFSFGSDLYHGETWETEEVRNAVKAANSLRTKAGVIAVKDPFAQVPCPNQVEGVKVSLWELMFRGRAASKLTDKPSKKSWREFTKCPYEDFVNQKRVHIDPFGWVHVCQGISIGNAFEKPLSEIIQEYDPSGNPILEPLIRGGPAALVEKFNLPREDSYADACHLCFAARLALRNRFPTILVPNQMYGETP
jgi:MoaA/NifB/PqqE/SkfB family radical SAM enzyme